MRKHRQPAHNFPLPNLSRNLSNEFNRSFFFFGNETPAIENGRTAFLRVSFIPPLDQFLKVIRVRVLGPKFSSIPFLQKLEHHLSEDSLYFAF